MQTVIIIEEETFIRDAFMEALQDNGHRCSGATNFDSIADAKGVELVVFPYQQLESFRRVRSYFPQLKGIALGGPQEVEKPSDIGHSLSGSFRVGDLAEAVEHLLPRSTTRTNPVSAFFRAVLGLASRPSFA
jgi:hypothetical protein